jgi:hypothetical protein
MTGATMKYLLALLIALVLGACTDPARNLYNGIKASNDAKKTPEERAQSPTPSYDEYKKERDAQTTN